MSIALTARSRQPEPIMIRGVSLLLVVLVLVAFEAVPAAAQSWVFRPSYYSHHPVTPVEIGRRPQGGPVFSRPSGQYVNSGWRQMRSTITVGGRVYDHVNVWESWIQTGGQN